MQVVYAIGDRVLVDGQLHEIVERASNRWGGAAYRISPLGRAPTSAIKKWLNPRSAGSRASVVDRTSLHDLVHGFYAKVRVDPVLGPVFEARLADRWEPHLAKMVSFWASVMLAEGSFDGSPMHTHRRLTEGEPAHFERWLALFRMTVGELFDASAAAELEGRAMQMARGLSTGMFGRPFDT